MKKALCLKTVLFISYTLIILGTIVAVCIGFYVQTSNTILQNAQLQLQNVSQTVRSLTDEQVEKMNDVSVNAQYSNIIKDNIASLFLSTVQETGMEQLESEQLLAELLSSVLGVTRPVQQIYLYDFNGNSFGVGCDGRKMHKDMRAEPWFNSVVAANGSRVLSLPEQDESLAKFFPSNASQYFIALRRMYYNKTNSVQGVIETKQCYDTVFGGSAKLVPDGFSMYIYDKDGFIIYPADQIGANAATLELKLEKSLPQKNCVEQIGPFFKRKIAGYTYSDFTQWTICVAAEKSLLMKPLSIFNYTALSVGIFAWIAAAALAFGASNAITTPIKQLTEELKDFSIRKKSQLGNSEIVEVQNLFRTYETMQEKLDFSIQARLNAQKQETEARVKALQSQINPHFLYNTLAAIGAMAEELPRNGITQMCEDLCDLLRYASSHREMFVPLSKEISYAKSYLRCLEARYGNSLTTSFSVSEQLNEISVPKLILQPLIENSIKYGTTIKPPWHISVCAEVENGFWRIRVQDNGPGFSEKAKKKLYEEINKIKQSGKFPAMEPNGMGLLNVYLRLYLLYQDKMIFEIQTVPAGSVIEIGGRTEHKEGYDGQEF